MTGQKDQQGKRAKEQAGSGEVSLQHHHSVGQGGREGDSGSVESGLAYFMLNPTSVVSATGKTPKNLAQQSQEVGERAICPGILLD